MKLRVLLPLSLGLLSMNFAFAADSPVVSSLTSTQQKISYSIGMDLGMHLKAQGLAIDPNILLKGVEDALNGKKPLMSAAEISSTLTNLQKDLVAKQQAAFNQANAQNLKEGQNFMTANKAKSGVVTTASGLQYRVLTSGKGNKPVENDLVTVDYSGSFTNGKVFDSSYQRGKSVTFPLSENDIIKGWVEVLKLMPVGSTYEVVIPPALGFGPQGVPNIIGPNQTLVFKIHLVSIQKPPKAS